MLNLTESGFGSAARGELLLRIATAVQNGRRTYLFVPEQQTLAAEREMADILPSYAPKCFEVTNFTRFSDTAFRILGGICGRYSTPEEEELIMWQVLSELSRAKIISGKSKITPATARRALAAVHEMQSLAILPEQLAEAMRSEEMPDRRLGEKLSDLIFIYTEYRRRLNERFSSISDDMTWLADRISGGDSFLSECEVFVDGFTSFTEPQYRLLGSLMGVCSLTVSLATPRSGTDAFEFSEIKATRSRLVQLANKAGSKTLVTRRADIDSAHPSIFERIAELLHRPSGTLTDDEIQFLREDGGRVRIFQAKTPFDECDFIAADIKRRVMEGGRYRDFAILARDPDKYCGFIDVSLERAAIPYFLSRKKDVSSLEGIKLICTAYEVLTHNFRKNELLTYVKCGLCGISRDERDEFELYVQRWNIDGYRFTDGIAWNMNPSGYRNTNVTDADRLIRLNKTREKIVAPLIRLSENSKAAATVKEQAEALFGFITEIGLEDSLLERAKELQLLGERTAAEECARLWEVICDCLDKLVAMFGDTSADAETFISKLSVLFRGAAIGRIPARRDEVTVGSAEMLRLYDKKYVYLIGVNDGEFPATPKDTSYFSERDKAHLARLGLPINPDMSVRGARELYIFSRAFTSANEGVTLMYTERSAFFAALSPSGVVERIKKLTDGAVKPIQLDRIPFADRIYSPEDALGIGIQAGAVGGAIRSALLASGAERIIKIAEGDISNGAHTLGGEALGIMYGDKLELSQSKLDVFLSCPFSYYAKYGLKLGEDDRAEIDSSIIGQFIHSVLENFFAELKNRGIRIGDLSEKERDALVERSSASYIECVLGEGYGRSRTKTAIARLCRAARPVIDGLCEEFSACKFTPKLFEIKTDGSSENVASPIVYSTRDGGKAIIHGIVDRVDTLNSNGDVYVRVVDYKTGTKNFSPEHLKEGENLQMFLYMKSITETESPAFRKRLGAGPDSRLIPAGVIYSHTSVKDVTVDSPSDAEALQAIKQKNRGDGMVLIDEVSLSAMNPDYLPLTEPTKKKPSVLDPTKTYTEAGWADICTNMERVVLDIVEDMKSGNISAAPKKLRSKSYDPCTYCTYADICRKEKA